MLTPKQLEDIPQRLVELYSEIENDIIADMAKRLARMDFIPSAEWQYKKLLDMGAVHEYIIKKLSEASGIQKKELEQLMKEAGVRAVKGDVDVYNKAGMSPAPLKSSLPLQNILRTGIENTNGLFENLTRSAAVAGSRQFGNALDRAWLNINTGAFSYNEAKRMAIKELTDKGLAAVSYPNGKTDHLDVAVRRAVVTGINQTALKMQEQLATEMETDLVEVTAHAGARTGKGIADHAEWQGKIYSRSGTHTIYRSLVEKTGYGKGAGLGGWNCRHNMFPFIEGASEPAYTQEELDKLNAPMYKYNDKDLTEYGATQQQRHIERNIRKYKREYLGMKAAGQSGAADIAAAKLSHWQAQQKDFIKQTGLKRQHDRECVVSFGRSEAARAVNLNKRVFEQAKKVLSSENIPKTLAEFNKVGYNANGELLKELSSLPYETAKSLNSLFNNRVIRSWYIAHNKQIPHLVDPSKAIKEQAFEAYMLRNANKKNARDLMRNEASRIKLDKEEPYLTFDQILADKAKRKGLSGDDLYRDIILSSVKTRSSVNKKYGLED